MSAGGGRRQLHPGAWWLWALGLAAAAMRTTNPILLALVFVVAAYVVAARRPSAPWGWSFRSFVWLGAFVVAIRVALQVVVGVRLPGHTLFSLPEVALPDWAAGVSLGGPVTLEAIVQASVDGFRLAVLLACFGAANSLASSARLLRCLPAVLYELGVAATVALTFAPQAVAAVGRVHEARRLRGRPTRGLAGVRGVALPVLEGALERSVQLAASMDARGYGRRATVPPAHRRVATGATLAGLLALAAGLYGLLGAAAPGALGLPVLAAGSALLAAGLFAGGRRTVRTRYRPDRWGAPEWVVAASGALAIAGVVVAGRLDPGSLAPSVFPLEAPTLPWAALAGIAAGLVPAVAAPEQS